MSYGLIFLRKSFDIIFCWLLLFVVVVVVFVVFPNGVPNRAPNGASNGAAAQPESSSAP